MPEMRNIFTYIILLVSLQFIFPLYASAQDNKEEEIKIDWWQGIRVEVDAFSAVMSAVNKETYSFEGNVQINLKEKYFPIVEVGFAGANRLSEKEKPGFKTNGLFTRIGIDYNLLKPNTPDVSIRRYFFVGIRYSFSNFSYDITNIQVANDYWGGSKIYNENKQAYKQWLEVGGGLRVEVFKNVFLGWGVRRKISLGKKKEYDPWYIPGIGIESIGKWQFSYTIGYSF